jgi:hypothetical protein
VGSEQPDSEQTGNALWRAGEVWHLRYGDEKGDFPVRGNQFLGWLAKLLARPNRALTVAELHGDPEGKLAADAGLGGENAVDKEGLRRIWERIEEIDAAIEKTGGSETLENEKADLLKEVEGHSAKGRMGAGVRKACNNITTQKRQFIGKLKAVMPELAAHLKACLIPSANDFSVSYRPPAGTPNWHVENPAA